MENDFLESSFRYFINFGALVSLCDMYIRLLKRARKNEKKGFFIQQYGVIAYALLVLLSLKMSLFFFGFTLARRKIIKVIREFPVLIKTCIEIEKEFPFDSIRSMPHSEFENEAKRKLAQLFESIQLLRVKSLAVSPKFMAALLIFAVNQKSYLPKFGLGA